METPSASPIPHSSSPSRAIRIPRERASRSAARNPALWSVPAYLRPGFPSPTTRSSGRLGFLFLLLRRFRNTGAFRRFRAFLRRRGDHFLDLRRVDRGDGHLHVFFQGRDALGEHDVSQVERLPDPQMGDADLDELRHAVRGALDLEAADDLLEDAPQLDPRRLSPKLERHLDPELLPEGHLVEVHVDDPVGDGIGLDVLQYREGLLRAGVVRDAHLDHHGAPLRGDEELLQVAPLEFERPRLDPLAVYDPRNLPLEQAFPVLLLAGAHAAGRRKFHHGHFLSPPKRTASLRNPGSGFS